MLIPLAQVNIPGCPACAAAYAQDCPYAHA